jgi:hypothetical protein
MYRKYCLILLAVKNIHLMIQFLSDALFKQYKLAINSTKSSDPDPDPFVRDMDPDPSITKQK